MLRLKGDQAEDDGKAGERDEPGGEGEREALGHELAFGARNVYEVIGRLDRGGVERLATDRDVVVVASADLALLEPDLSGLLALNRSVGIVGDGAIGFAHREREAAGARLHTVEHVIDLHASEQLLEPSGMNHDLHESVGVARIVVGCHADVLNELPGHLVFCGLLDVAVYALQELPEGEGLVGLVGREREVLIRSVRNHHGPASIEQVHARHLEHVGKFLHLGFRREGGVRLEDVGRHACLG